jgi:transposase InsO family protein
VEGSKRYAEVFELIYRRQAARPNEIWQADHTLLDLWVVTPSGKPGRPWLTVIEDDHSRAIAGYAVNLDAPSALQTALALRQAIWRKSEPGWHICGISSTSASPPSPSSCPPRPHARTLHHPGRARHGHDCGPTWRTRSEPRTAAGHHRDPAGRRVHRDQGTPPVLRIRRRRTSPRLHRPVLRTRTVFYTPESSLTTVKTLDADLNTLTFRADLWISEHVNPGRVVHRRSHRDAPYVELIIIDEAERLRPQALEHLRARFDRSRAGLILIGMPGIEKRLARYPQLYSRIGFAHHYRPLGKDELTFVLT